METFTLSSSHRAGWGQNRNQNASILTSSLVPFHQRDANDKGTIFCISLGDIHANNQI